MNNKGAQAWTGANRAGKTAKRPRTKRRASTLVKGGPQDRQGNVCNDASAAMTLALRRQQWQWHQGNVCNDASTVTATIPKRRQGNVHDDASAAMMPAPRQRQWQQRQGDIRNEDSATPAYSSGNFAEEGEFAR
jgi:hypothetical protein